MKRFSKYNLIGLFVSIIIILMSVGYALYKQDLGLNGDVTLKKQGKLEILSANIVESECVDLADYTDPTINELNLSFKVSGSSNKFVATYLIEINNGTLYDYTYTDFSFNIDSSSSDSKISVNVTDATTGNVFNPGEILSASESKTFKVQLTIETSDTNVSMNVNGSASFIINNEGNIIANINPKTGDLRGSGTISCFTVSVANTYTYNRNFNLNSSNENILLVNKDGTLLNTLQVKANSTEEYEMCTKVSESSSFLTDEATTTITLTSAGVDSINVGKLTFTVDKDEIATDKEIPTVGNVNISIPEENTVVGEALISWDRIDTGGSSITNYYIVLYNSETGTSSTYETGSSLTSYKLTNLSAGNYYAKVYGIDEAGNVGKNYCDNATTDNGYCSLSNTVSLKWEYTITFNLTNLQHDNETTTTATAIINNSFNTTLQLNTSSQWYSLPNSITITMNENTLTSGTDYTYNSSSGEITIKKITGDVTISASASGGCLIKGTKITLANGMKKNIEDIGYDDLLLVWDYEKSSYAYEYPIWIEKAKKTKKYQKTTFSDGSVLKTYGEHGVFSQKLNAFISVNDKNNFKIGTEIAKVDSENKIYYVKITNIEIIEEETEYYHIVSTRYYNVIANNFLTTDGKVEFANLYGFGDNINWLTRDISKLDLYTYDDFKDILPFYLYEGLRVAEGKVLSEYINLLEFKEYFRINQLNVNMILPPLQDSLNNRLWMVTTSDDNINDKKSFLKKENSYYTLKLPVNRTNFKYWYNMADGKKYKPNDTVKVSYGMHFVAVYE